MRRHADSDRSAMFARRPEVAMRRPAPDLIVVDTLGKLAAHGHGVGGYCPRVPASLLGLDAGSSASAAATAPSSE